MSPEVAFQQLLLLAMFAGLLFYVRWEVNRASEHRTQVSSLEQTFYFMEFKLKIYNFSLYK